MVKCQHCSFSFDDDPCPEDVNQKHEQRHCVAACKGPNTLSLSCSYADRESLRCCSLASPCVLQGNEQLSLSPSRKVMQGPRRMLFQGSLATLCPLIASLPWPDKQA